MDWLIDKLVLAKRWLMLIIIFLGASTGCLLIVGALSKPALVTGSNPSTESKVLPNLQVDGVVENTIVEYAIQYGVDPRDALRIARCESGFNRHAKNVSSTAKGVYQFLDSTWEYVEAPGHQYDFLENIRQFMIWYPIHPEWWECK